MQGKIAAERARDDMAAADPDDPGELPHSVDDIPEESVEGLPKLDLGEGPRAGKPVRADDTAVMEFLKKMENPGK
jgi:hypothetical protein